MRPLITLSLLGWMSAVGAAPVPKAAGKPQLYFPTKQGDKRVLESTLGERTFEVTETVAKVEAKGENFRVTIEWSVPVPPAEFEVSAKGVTQVAAGGKDLLAPVVMLKLPAKPGDKWTVKGSVAGLPDEVFIVGQEEEIEVPAGKFDAIRLESKTGGANGTIRTFWYAPNVGLIKLVSKSGDTHQTLVLKSFTPGK